MNLLARRIASAALLTATIVAAGALAGQSIAQDATDSGPVTIPKRSFKTGDVNRYKYDIHAKFGDMEQRISMVFTETTKDAKPAGEFTLLNQFESVKADNDDITKLVPTVTVMRDKAGKLTNKTDGGVEQYAELVSNLIQSISTTQDAYVPKTAVKTGDTWPVTVTRMGIGGSTTAQGKATLVGTEVVGGVKSFKVKFVSDVDVKAQNLKAHNESLLNVDPANGRLLKLVAKVDGTAQDKQISVEQELSSLPAEKTVGK